MKFNNTLAVLDKVFSLLLIISVPTGLYFAFIYAPVERTMGLIQKIFYFHVASAWIGFFGLFITFLSSIIFLIKKNYFFDDTAYISAKIGLAFCTIVIVTGPLWARPVWGTFWLWSDVRLTTMLILWFLYASYIMLRSAVEDKAKRAKYSSILGIIAFIDVPVVFLSIRLWSEKSIHPNVLQKGGGGLDSCMLTALIVCIIVFTILYFALLIRKLRIRILENKINFILENKEDNYE